jgi:hypothetical protein
MARLPAQIDFPERVWLQDETGNWSSNPPTREDFIRRGEVIHDLKAVSNSEYIPFDKER